MQIINSCVHRFAFKKRKHCWTSFEQSTESSPAAAARMMCGLKSVNIKQCGAERVICPRQTEGQTRIIYGALKKTKAVTKRKIKFCHDCCAPMEKWQLEPWAKDDSLAVFATLSSSWTKQHVIFGHLSCRWNFVAMDLINTGRQNIFDRTASS